MAIQAIPHYENIAPEMSDSIDYAGGMLTLRGLARMLWRYAVKHMVIWTRSVPTGGTDGIFIYINPDFFSSLPNHSQRAFLIGHEVLHILLRHGWRGMAFRKAGYFSIDSKLGQIPFVHRILNYVTDAIINEELLAYGLEAIEGVIFDDRFDRDTLADEAYLIKWQEEQEDKNDDDAADDESGAGDSGEPSPSMGNPMPDSENSDDSEDDNDADGESGSEDGDGEESDGDESQDSGDGEGSEHEGHDTHLEPKFEGTDEEIAEAQREEESAAARNLQEAAAEHSEAVSKGEQRDVGTGASIEGEVHAGMNRHSAAISWREELADLFRMSGSGGDVNHSRMNRRRFNVMGVITPANMGRLAHITLIGDISGSVEREPFRATVAEMAVMMDELEPTDGVSVLFTNTEVYEHHDIYSGGELADLTIPLGGGTYLSSALDYMDEKSMTSDVVVAFTDCYIDNDDLKRLVENDVIIIIDHVPCQYMRRSLEKFGARYIVAVDQSLAA